MTNADGQLWPFCLHIYRQPEVADACLWLQDERGVDVPVLLFGAWLSSCHLTLSDEAIGDVLATIRHWHDAVVVPLRTARRWLKQGQDWQGTESLRTEIKRLELDAERNQIERLETLAHLAQPATAPATELLGRIVSRYSGQPLDTEAAERVAVVARAI
ncbi:MAG: TIGR02444 family protein [Devosia sp.]